MDQLEFLKLHLLDFESYPAIVAKYSVSGSQLSTWWEDEEGKRIRASIKRSNTLFNNRVKNADFAYFEKKGKRFFYEWLSLQSDACAYCDTEGKVLRSLFDKDGGILSSKENEGLVWSWSVGMRRATYIRKIIVYWYAIYATTTRAT